MTKGGGVRVRASESDWECEAKGKVSRERTSEWVRKKRISTTSKSFLFNEISTCGKCSSCFWFSMSIFLFRLLLVVVLVFFLFRYRNRYWKWTNRNKNNDSQKEQTRDRRKREKKLSANDYFRESNTLSKLNWTKLLNPTDKLNKSLWCACASVFASQLKFEGVRKLTGVPVGPDERKIVNEEWESELSRKHIEWQVAAITTYI